jgi:hypothetical protein
MKKRDKEFLITLIEYELITTIFASLILAVRPVLYTNPYIPILTLIMIVSYFIYAWYAIKYMNALIKMKGEEYNAD